MIRILNSNQFSVLLTLIGVISVSAPASCSAQQEDSPSIKSVDVNCEKIAFYPARWRKADADFAMLAWEGKNVVLITKQGEYNVETINRFVDKLDEGWETYAELIGKTPRPLKQFNGKPTICAIPKSNLSCGYGCGYVGATGIEVSAFYNRDLSDFQDDPNQFKHYYFYEMGRNYFVFGDRHSLFTTGFAVFMRYVCMDRLGCEDGDVQTRETIERCEELLANSDIQFFDAFTNLGNGEKSNRLRGANGQVISPSDQPVMYATAMLKLRNDYGGDEFVSRFYQSMLLCKAVRANNVDNAQTQVLNWLVCASIAAKQNLAPIFTERWRMPLTENQIQTMEQVDWASETKPMAIVDKLIQLP